MGSVTQGEFRGTERFAVLRRLGEGGFGVVYEVFDRQRQVRVALKALRRLDAAALYRFKQEFRSLADVNHPNLVSLYELLVDRDEWFFTMELIDGVSLLEHLRGEGAESIAPALAGMTPDEDVTRSMIARVPGDSTIASPHAPVSPAANLDRVRESFAQLAEGISALHEAGVIHRDIKPSNVMVNRQGRVVLLDFGLATELTPVEPGSGTGISGTPAYMSPEQGANLPAGEPSDWYSVGVMLYQILTGRLPFTGRMYEVLRDKQKFEPPPAATVVAGVPAELNDLCRDLLRIDPRTRPAGAEVLRRLGGVGPLTVPHRRAPLVGRERHLAALMEAYWAARQGRAVVAHVHGRSGMGKTVLVRRFLEDLRRREPSALLLLGRCYERESVPYKALDSLVDALTQALKRFPSEQAASLLPAEVPALARLFPVLREVDEVVGAEETVLAIPDSQQLRRRAFAALRELLGRLAARAPLVLFIDDVQWGDLDSGALLAEILSPPDPPPLLLVISYRSEEAETSPVLARLRTDLAAETRQIEVGELSAAEAQEVAQVLLGGAAARAEVIARESGGSPFFVQELARFQDEGESSPPTLDEVLHRRIVQLEEPVRRFLEVVAVAGRPLDLEVVRQAAAPIEDEYAILAQLRSGRLLRTRGAGELETYHDRVRETVVARLPAAALRQHHSRLAVAWEASGRADPETLATHFHGAGERGKAARYAVAAADRAAQALAFDRAARLYRMALELDALDGGLKPKLAAALANAGRGPEAARAYLAAAEGIATSEALEFRRRAAEQFLISGHVDEGLATLERVLQMVGMTLPATPLRALLLLLLRRVQLWFRGLGYRERPASQSPPDLLLRVDVCWSVAIGLGLVDLIRGTEFQARHLLLALRAGEPYRVARALALEVGYSAVPGVRAWPYTEKVLRLANALAERVSHPHTLGLAAFTTGVAAECMGRMAEAAELCSRAEALLRQRCTGVTWEIDSSAIFGIQATRWTGEWNELELRLSVLLRDAEERGDRYAASFWYIRHLYWLALRDDQPEQARRQHDRGMALWTFRGYHMQHYWSLFALSEIDLYTGQAGTAWQRCMEQTKAVQKSLILRLQIARVEWLHLRARLAVALGRLDDAERIARHMERPKMRWATALALLVRASVATSRGRRQEALALWQVAEQASQDLHLAMLAVAARRRRGELLEGEQGAALIQEADARLASQKVRNPARMMAILAPVWEQQGDPIGPR